MPRSIRDLRAVTPANPIRVKRKVGRRKGDKVVRGSLITSLATLVCVLVDCLTTGGFLDVLAR